MFTAVQNELSERLRNARAIYELVKRQELDPAKSFENKVLKGLFFVALYGALEKGLSFSVSICIESLNQLNLDLLQIKPVLWALVFDSDCVRIEQGGGKKWKNRNMLFSEIKDVKAKSIDSILFPTSIGNIKKEQIEGIWKTFDLQSVIFPDPSVIGRLETLAENRMSIAHGRRIASEVGSNYSADELLIFYDKIADWSTYVISCFDSYIRNEEYKIV